MSAPQTHQRAAPDTAANERATWLTGATLALGLAMILGVLAVIAWRGFATFWPAPLQRVTLESGETFLAAAAGSQPIEGTERERLRFMVGNRDLGQQSYRFVDLEEIASVEPAPDAVLIERDSWGAFVGVPRAVVITKPGGGVERLTFGEDMDLDELEELRGAAMERQSQIRRLTGAVIPAIESEAAALRYRAESIRVGNGKPAGLGLPIWAWLLVLACGVGSGVWVVRSILRGVGTARPVTRTLVIAASAACLLAASLEHPWAGAGMSEAEKARAMERIEARLGELDTRRAGVLERIASRRSEDQRYRLEVVAPESGRIAPRSLAEPDEPMLLSQAVRVIGGGDRGLTADVGIYLARWWDYLSRPPGEEPGSGGVWPVILGTVALTLLLTIGVVPLGVIAALYLREYAKQGVVVSVIRIAINNLAGVPSIVYGMFGLGFFCYAVGGYVDGGPEDAASRVSWWMVVVGLVAMVGLAGGVSVLIASARGGVRRVGGLVCGLLWMATVVAAAWLIATTPYFGGFFAEKLPEQPTFGGRGILWASLTLALLTLPVVIVATEEAIAAVPNSMREGSFGCGASRWQTVRRIVLPSALPGIMTGAILAMARGAGEVAPLMLVGAVNLAPAPPVSGEFPFVHGDRTFMHLGFHIYNLGFQSPDAEATEPLVWTTALLLVAIVLALNLTAVIIRARLRLRSGSAV